MLEYERIGDNVLWVKSKSIINIAEINNWFYCYCFKIPELRLISNKTVAIMIINSKLAMRRFIKEYLNKPVFH